MAAALSLAILNPRSFGKSAASGQGSEVIRLPRLPLSGKVHHQIERQ